MKTIFGVLAFLVLCYACAHIAKVAYTHGHEREQRIKREIEDYHDDVRKECRLRHPLDYMERVICYDDLLQRRSFV